MDSNPRSYVIVGSQPLQLEPLMQAVRHDGAGAVVVFVGTVRDHNEGQAVSALEYEAYESMAVAEMQRIADEICAEHQGVRLAAGHRTGELRVGDIAAICVASAAHRDQAFEACRLLIDRIKERVPIWKRERGAEGARWLNWDRDEQGHG